MAADEDDGEVKRSVSIAAYSVRSSTVDLSLGYASHAYMEAAPWGQYVAALDADMIPLPHWLRALVPHIENDAHCAMVCPPQVRIAFLNTKSLTRLADIQTQTFYNMPVNDPLTQTMSHFASMTEVVNDALGHANCLGSGYIMRRVALESIGGFPTESLAEDICCSATLLGEGWKTAFVPDVVQYGSAPESYLGHIKQRTRWVSSQSTTRCSLLHVC
jgi:cellulose synthase/poly-beta-1,6-N-acetylglucosamine synthase-like glycosyltransferase